MPFEELKGRQGTMWGTGPYQNITETITDIHERVMQSLRPQPEERFLDLACGTGAVAELAAASGANVTGLDLAPGLIETAQQRALDRGLEIEYVVGDAEQLPFEDGSFDRVLSTFGHMFAPRHQQTADAMTRVCRPDGAIVTATWTPEGVGGAIFAAGASFMPPPPDYASPPILWGREDYVREMFGSAAKEFEFERHLNWIEAESLDAFADLFMERFPPMVTAQAMLGDRFQELRERIVDIWRDANVADDGTLRLPQEYLLSVIRL